MTLRRLRKLLVADAGANGGENLRTFGSDVVPVYVGPFLDGEEMDWVLEERERLHSLFVRAASELLLQFGNARRCEEGIAVARRLLALDPFRELIHRSLLILLVLNGQRAEALRGYERWSAAFRRELSIDPMPQPRARSRPPRRPEPDRSRQDQNPSH